MALRIPWDKQETAILIDAYIRVKNKELSQRAAVKDVSNLLRRRAVLSGIEIDEIFRNENGISMQMKIVGGLVDEKPSGLHSATKMFADMVALYKTRRSEFDEILIQAKGECVMQVSVQDKFFAWLSARVSSAQLSEFYFVCRDIENFCMNKRILVVPLFETTDFETLQHVTNTIRTNRMFQFKYFRQLGKMKKVMEYYLAFLDENPVQKVAQGNSVQEEVLEAVNITHAEDIETVQESAMDEDAAVTENVNATSESENIITVESVESNDEGLIWNFANERIDFESTSPIEVYYFGESKKCHGWQDAFMHIIGFLHEDYPAILRGMVGYRFAGVGKVILSGRASLDRLGNAQKINDGLYLETDCNPNEIITIVRLLMNKCNMDYGNIEILYRLLENVEKDQKEDYEESHEKCTNYSSTEQSVRENEKGEIIRKTRTAFIKWAKLHKMESAEMMMCLFEAKKCSDFAKKYGYIKEEHLFLIKDSNILEYLFSKLKNDKQFIEFDNKRKNGPAIAMKALIDFFRETETRKPITSNSTVPMDKSFQKSVASISVSAIDQQVEERYNAVLLENFSDGFRYEKAIDRNRFKMYYSDMFGKELTEDDESLVRTLIKIGTIRDERIFVKDKIEQKDLLEEINDTIMETFRDGASCIYLDCLFVRFQEQLAEMIHIYNVNSLESVLFNSEKRNYFKKYNYIFKYNKQPAPSGDVIGYMKKKHLPVSYSEIEKNLWYIPLDKIKHILITTPSIVNVASEAYLYAPNLPVSENELHQIAELISHALLQRNYISDVELMQLIEEHCPSVLMNTPDYPMWGLRNAFAYLLRDKFSFRGAIISDKDEEISRAEVFSDFCQRSEHVTVDELKQFAGELKTNIATYLDSVYSEMIRVNQNEFVRKDRIQFDIEQTDSVLDNLIQSAYAPIKSINLFLHFPVVDVPWNNFVLESYVIHYSRKFKLLHASYTITDCCGAIVRKEAGISDYRMLIVDVLAKNTGWKNKKEALQLLVDLGYQQRRSYSDIEKVMQEAKAKLYT